MFAEAFRAEYDPYTLCRIAGKSGKLLDYDAFVRIMPGMVALAKPLERTAPVPAEVTIVLALA